MTKEWSEVNKVLKHIRPYHQQRFHEVPYEQNAENVLFAIRHFNTALKVCRFENGTYNPETGRAERGDAQELTLYFEIQPYTTQSGGEVTLTLDEGERIEGMYQFWYDPYYEKNLQDGEAVYLRQSDSRFVAGDGYDANVYGHADLIQFMGEQYIIRKIKNWASSSHEDDNGQDTGYQWGVMTLWRDHHHEREATITNDEFLY